MSDLKPSDCVVLVPVASHIEPECESGLHALARLGYPVRFLRGCSQVDLARSALATRAYDDGFAETLWIDSDVAFDPDDVELLRSHGLPFVAGLYPKKGPREFACKFSDFGSYPFGAGGGLTDVRYVGMGFTLVRREVYDAIETGFAIPRCAGNYDPAQPVVPYFIPLMVREGDGWCYLSEDFAFTHRARAAGFPPVADTRIKLGHVGRHKYTWDDFAPRAEYAGLEFTIEAPKRPEDVSHG